MSESVTTDEGKKAKQHVFSRHVDAQKSCENIADNARRHYMPGADRLYHFKTNEVYMEEKMEKGCVKTNIQSSLGEMYHFTPERKHILFDILEECRRENTTTHYLEKQGEDRNSKTGIMLDYDIYTFNKEIILTERQSKVISNALAKTLWTYLDMGDHVSIDIFYTCKPQVSEKVVEGNIQYKYGFHIIAPGIKVDRYFKKYLIAKFSKNSKVMKVLKDMGCETEPESCLDTASASVPVVTFGSCKIGSTPYILKYAIKCTIENDDFFEISSDTIGLKEFDKYNQVSELSIVTNAKYPDKEPFINKLDYEVKEEFKDDVINNSLFKKNDLIGDEEIHVLTNELDILTANDTDAVQVKSLLDLLDQSYYTEYEKWRNVIFALSNTSKSYKPLANYFSAKSAEQWKNGGKEGLDSIWETQCGENRLTLGSIHYWAKQCSPERYYESLKETNASILMAHIYTNEGDLSHNIIAKLLKSMLNKNFCVDVDPTGKSYVWYEFVSSGISCERGQLWKWRRELKPDNMSIYISDKLPKLLDRAAEILTKKQETSEQENEVKYIAKILKNLKSAGRSLGSVTFKANVIKEAQILFRKRGFTKSLDTDPLIFGVANGLIKLDTNPTLINHYHEYPVSKYTDLPYKKFDPYNPTEWEKIVLDGIRNVIVEPDARLWIMFFVSQCLAGGFKEGLMLIWEGGGQNGKTAFLSWIASALGKYADKISVQLLCSERESAKDPNSALANLEGLRFGFSEESNRGDELNPARMKEIVNTGFVSCRDLNEKQKTIPMTANFITATQFNFIVNTNDHGTWRRIRRYVSKSKFSFTPDLNNIYEKADDPKFANEYPNTPEFKTAVLSIMVYFYSRLQKEYDGKIKNVESQTIDGYTQEYRVSQDHLHKWLSQNIIISAGNEDEEDSCYTTTDLANYYIRWYEQTVKKKGKNSFEVSDITKEIESSAISKFLVKTKTGQSILKNCRVDEESLPKLEEGEELLLSSSKVSRVETKFWEDPEAAWWLPPAMPEIVKDEKDFVPDDEPMDLAEGYSKKKKSESESLMEFALKMVGVSS